MDKEASFFQHFRLTKPKQLFSRLFAAMCTIGNILRIFFYLA